MNKCVHCEKSISSNEELKCLDKIWTQGYCKCQECGVPLNMKTYKEYSKMSLEKSTKFGSSDLTNPSINGHRLPSYVGISCVISGYSNYSKFCASTRPTYTRGYSSPTIRVDSKECAEVNSSRDKSSFEEKKVISNNSVSEKECVEVSNGEVKEKSLVQQKIESLYGKSFASGWRHSRLKQKNSKHNGESAQHRSPSCPPGMLQTRLDTKESRPVFRHVTKEFLDQLQSTGDTKSEKRDEDNSCLKSRTNNSSDRCPVKNISNVKDGNWFLFELNKTCEDIKRMVTEINDYIDKESSKMSEEVMGKLLSFVGKANLLLNQKLSQFRELTMKNINQNSNDEFVTTNEDLEGFWEMVLIQIYEIQSVFKEICKLKESNWEVSQEKKNVNKVTQPKSRSPRKNSSPKVVPIGKSDISAAKEEARRNRLKEAKKLHASKMASKEDENITIFIASNETKSNEICLEKKPIE